MYFQQYVLSRQCICTYSSSSGVRLTTTASPSFVLRRPACPTSSFMVFLEDHGEFCEPHSKEVLTFLSQRR